LEKEYNEKGRNVDHHQAKSHNILVDDGVTILTKEVEEFDISEIIGEVVDEPVEGEEGKCKRNLVIKVVEYLDEDIVTVEFYVELAFLEEWLANPK
jgi:hypothetical protein